MTSKIANFQKLVTTSLTIGVISYSLPAQAVMYGAENELSGLEMNVTSCVKRAYRAVSAIAVNGIKNNNRGYSGNVGKGDEVTVSINCAPVGQYSAVNISVVYVGNGGKVANSVRSRLKSEFLK